MHDINFIRNNPKKFDLELGRRSNKPISNKILDLDRQFLHAKQLGFDHPRIGERLEFSSNIPNELNDILKKLRKLSK